MFDFFLNWEMVRARAHMNSSFPTRVNLPCKLYEIRRRSEVHETQLFARNMHLRLVRGEGCQICMCIYTTVHMCIDRDLDLDLCPSVHLSEYLCFCLPTVYVYALPKSFPESRICPMGEAKQKTEFQGAVVTSAVDLFPAKETSTAMVNYPEQRPTYCRGPELLPI